MSATWIVIWGLGIGTFLIRFSFLGMIKGREIPAWAMRLLRYVPVAVLPGLVAPLVVWPAATGGAADPARILAGAAALGIGAWTRGVFGAILGGMATLWIALAVLG